MKRTSWALALAALLTVPRAADACGGCFAPPPPTPERAQVVTDHRMVLSLSQRQTTLWDQIRYTGDPEDFVWVLPVANAATLRIGLADDAFVEELDQLSAPFVTANLPECFSGRGSAPRDAGGGAVFGCGAGSPGMGTTLPGSESTRIPRDGEATVGPYAIVVIGTKAGGGQLDTWLEDNGFQIPRETRDVINYYIDLQFDFIIMRLAPGAGVHQMQPVRITTRGYSPVLPLRMVAAGVGDKVGLTLMVLAESRVEAQGFRNVTLREQDLRFDYETSRSNWRQLFNQALARDPGRVWVTESVQNVFEHRLSYEPGAPRGDDGGLPDAMEMLDGGMWHALDGMAWDPDGEMRRANDAMLFGDGGGDEPLEADAGEADGGAGEPDGASEVDADTAGDDASASGADDASASGADDAGPRDAGPVFEMDGMTPAPDGGLVVRDGGPAPPYDPHVDRRVAFTGLSGRAVLTRMRTELSLADLNRDLILDASDGGLVPVEYVADELVNAPRCPGLSCAVIGGTTPALLEGVAVAVFIARWRRRRARRKAASQAETAR